MRRVGKVQMPTRRFYQVLGIAQMGFSTYLCGANDKRKCITFYNVLAFMKKSVFLGLLAGIVLAACEKPEELVPVEQAAQGVYAGWTNATAAYFPDGMANEGDSIAVTAVKDGVVKVDYHSTSWGTATFSSVTVSESEEAYVFQEAEGTIAISLGGSPHGGGAAPKEYAAILKQGVISKDKKTYEFVISAPAVMGGTTLTFKEGEM